MPAMRMQRVKVLLAPSVLAGASLAAAFPSTVSASSAAPTARGPRAGSPLPAICHAGPGLASCYTMVATISGAVNVRGTSSMPEMHPCNQYLADTAGGGTEVPLPVVALDDYRDSLAVDLEGWKGVGTYPIEQSTTESHRAFFSPDFTAGGTSYGPLVRGMKPATGTAVVRSGGDVRVSFSGLSTISSSSKKISGTVTYSCRSI